MSSPDLEALTEVRDADVYKSGHRAATLQRVDGGIEFSYLAEYLDSDRPAVATTLPLTDEAVRTAAGAVPAFFAGLLPEGRRLTSLRQAVKTSADDELSLLLAVGHDCVGDVQVVPAGSDPTPAEPVAQVAKGWSDVRFADVLADAGVIDPVGLPGVQDKVSARVISVPVARAGERFLLKVDPPEYPHLVDNEAYFLARASRAKISAAHAEVVHDADERPGLLVRRFDRIAQPDGSALAVACEDACQVLGLWPADKYRVTSEVVVTALAGRCASRAVAVRTLYRQLCFGWLTGNGDIHAKNLSILATPEGEWRVSPAYDLPSTVPYGDRTSALSLLGRTRGISRNHLLGFAAEIGLPERAARNVLDELLDHLADLVDELLAGAIPFTTNVTLDLVKELRFRHRQAMAGEWS